MKILDADHPAFRPLWVRLGIVVSALAWAAFEASQGEAVWALLFGAIGLYGAWALLIAYRPGRPEKQDKEPDDA